ncbi:hypothetical protein FACS189487_09460 [Campylobacterota bacterium]|nr:hypothetical protein FACS189487_09460 [Campylobacterota bacterium]
MGIRHLVLFLTAIGAACAGDGGGVDIGWRTLNFVIFAALVYWLFAGFFKKFFGERSQSIALMFERAQDRAKEARLNREKAQADLALAKESAEAILKSAHEEAAILTDRTARKMEEEIKILHKLKEESRVVSENKMIRTVVARTLGEILSSGDILNNQDAIVENLRKRVA